jgi:hypothetical protein
VDALTDADLLREVVNTVGRPGKLGQHVRCVVSVGMLTEGWDANTVTHIVGVRAFGSQLLCEQVAGRALRRRQYFVDPKTGLFPPEYAHIIGVPFRFFQGGKAQAPAAAGHQGLACLARAQRTGHRIPQPVRIPDRAPGRTSSGRFLGHAAVQTGSDTDAGAHRPGDGLLG